MRRGVRQKRKVGGEEPGCLASRQQLKKWDVCTGGKDAGVSECVSQARGGGQNGKDYESCILKDVRNLG